MKRIGCSLRTQEDAVTGFVALDQSGRGYHCSHGIEEKLHEVKPITALRNHATIQGKLTVKEKRRQIGCACSKEVMASHPPVGGADYRL